MKTKKTKTKNSSSGTKNLVTKKMNFSELLERYPQAAEVLMNSGMHCIGCAASVFETIEQGAIMHGLDPDKLVEEINKKLSRGKKK
jgi:hybrid cluster-associated redox disulfide protein